MPPLKKVEAVTPGLNALLLGVFSIDKAEDSKGSIWRLATSLLPMLPTSLSCVIFFALALNAVFFSIANLSLINTYFFHQ